MPWNTLCRAKRVVGAIPPDQVCVRVRPPILPGEHSQPDVMEQTGSRSLTLINQPAPGTDASQMDFDYVAGQHVAQGDFFRGALACCSLVAARCPSRCGDPS